MPIISVSTAPKAVTTEQKRATVARQLATAWPRHVGGLLHFAARAGAYNRRAAVLGLPLLVTNPPLAVADELWRAVMDDAC